MATYLKDPGASLDYTIDWGAGYLQAASLTTSSWSVLPVEQGGLVVAGEAQTTTRTSVTLNGGIPGHFYRVTNQILTNDGKTDERSITIRVEQR